MLFNGSSVSSRHLLEIRHPLPSRQLRFHSASAPGLDQVSSEAQPDPLLRPKIVIQGWYGNGNLGDEIILECMLSELRSHLPGASFVVISDNPEDTKRRHGVESIARGGGIMPRLRRLRTLANADLFILGGGELLKQFGPSDVSILTWLGPLELAHEMGVRTMTYAVGVSDMLSARAEAVMKDILTKTDEVLVRDQQSLDVLRRVGIAKARLTADPALLFPELHPNERGHASSEEMKISLFVNKWLVTRNVVPDSESWERFKKRVAECVDSLIEVHKANVRFIPMQVANVEEDDRAVAHEIAGLARNRNLIEVRDSEVSALELLPLISESNVVIGMRLHSLILAAALGVPALAIEYQSKVRRFSYSIGASDWIVGVTDSGSDLIQNLCTKAALGAYPLTQVRERIPELQELARENARIAAALVSRPRKGSNRVSRTARGLIEVARRLVGRKERKHELETVAQTNAAEPNNGEETAPGQNAVISLTEKP
jgi:polysaccharide pyruvyl transferase CsaB